MKNRKKSIGVFLFATLLLFAAGCAGSGNERVLPTLAPTHTPVPDEGDKPAPTVAPDAEYTKIIELNGEDFNQTSYFMIEGEGSISVKPLSKVGSYSFYMSGRGESWHGLSIDVADKEGVPANVTGKNLYVSMWVYHESGKPENFTCSLQIKKPDGTTEVAGEIVKNRVPSDTWTLVQGLLPVYANVTEPRLRMEMTSGKDSFYFDEFRITYDEGSNVAAKAEYNVLSFEGLYYDFESKDHAFIGRGGNEKLSLKKGGSEDGAKYLDVSGRTQNWHGPAIDLSEYGLAGTQIWVSFSAAHGGSKDTMVKCTVQELPFGVEDEGKATYTQIVNTKKLAPGEWQEVTGKYTLKANTEKVILYFETDATEDICIDNVMITAKDPATLEVNPETGEIGEKVERMDTTGFTNIFTLTADGIKDETSEFILNDTASVERDSNGYSENGFKVSNRAATWAGVGLHFDNVGKTQEVIGKQLYVSFWVYQNSGKEQEFSATLQANKPDGTAVWPERVSLAVLPSGKWTYVEGLIPIYANVSVPQINFEMPSSADTEYFLDNIIVSYDPNSKVAAHQPYEEAVKDNQQKTDLDKLVLDFEDNNAFFASNGNGKPSIMYGGYESEKCLYVSERSANWHGVKADFSKYNIIGKTVNVSFWLYHEYDEPLQVIFSAEQNDGSSTSYYNVVIADSPADGKWAHYTGTYAIPAGMKKIYFYFESPDVDAAFYVDDIVIEVEN